MGRRARSRKIHTEIHTWTNKLACHSFMDSHRKHRTPGSGTLKLNSHSKSRNRCHQHSGAGSLSPQCHRITQRSMWRLQVQWVVLPERNPEFRESATFTASSKQASVLFRGRPILSRMHSWDAFPHLSESPAVQKAREGHRQRNDLALSTKPIKAQVDHGGLSCNRSEKYFVCTQSWEVPCS